MSEKRHFLENQKTQLDQWAKQLEQLRLRAKKMQVEASVKVENALDELRDKIESAQGRFKSMERSSGESLEEVRSRVTDIWEELKKALEKAKSRIG